MRKFKTITTSTCAAAFAGAALAVLTTTGVMAGESEWFETQGAKIRLISLPSANGQTIEAGLQILLDKGWKTYWRSPGDAGIPPLFDWSASENAAQVNVGFPVPDVFYENGMRSIGYEDGVTFSLIIESVASGEDISLNGDLVIGVCEEVCVPVELSLDTILPANADDRSTFLRAALNDRPMTDVEAGVGAVSCDVEPIRDGMRLTARVELPQMGRSEVAVLELPDRSIWVSEADVSREGETLIATADLVPPEAAPFALARQDVRITVIAGGQAVDIQGCG